MKKYQNIYLRFDWLMTLLLLCTCSLCSKYILCVVTRWIFFQVLLSAINSLSKRPGITNLHACLNLAINGASYFAGNPRQPAKNVLMFITDGNSADPAKTSMYLAIAKVKDIRTIAVPIGPDENFDDIDEWKNKVNRVERVASFAALVNATELFESFCRGRIYIRINE